MLNRAFYLFFVTAVAASALTRKPRMVENGRELVAWLKTLHGRAGYVVADYAVFDKESHATSPWPALVRVISFAFSTTP